MQHNQEMVFAKGAIIHSSVQKLNVIADLIRNQDVDKALLQLRFNQKRAKAEEFAKVLKQAIANAENNHGMDIDRLYVSRVLVNRAASVKRFRAKAKGKAGPITRRYSKITLCVSHRP